MVMWTRERCVQLRLRLIQKGKPNQNAYTELSNDHLRDDRLNEYWFPSFQHVRVEIECCWWEYNEERPKRALGGLTPGAHAKHFH